MTPRRSGHGPAMTKLLSDNRVIVAAFAALSLVNAYAMTHGYYA